MLKQLLAVMVLFSFSGVGLFFTALLLPYYAYTVYAQARQLSGVYWGEVAEETIKPILRSASGTEVYDKLNQYRKSQGLPEFLEEESACGSLNLTATSSGEKILTSCANCSQASLLMISKATSASQVLQALISDEAMKSIITDKSLTHLCVAEREEQLVLLVVKKENQKTVTPKTIPKLEPSAQAINFTEEQLWAALSAYRDAQRRSQITKDENLCSYARKRVQDHLTLRQTRIEAEYPNPDKYPLDAHAGFALDAESGYAFEATQMTQLAENLAYWPNAQAATHIIEWGWDSSTEGHREAQLGEWSKGCITGSEGFYVAIFGK